MIEMGFLMIAHIHTLLHAIVRFAVFAMETTTKKKKTKN